MEKFLVKYRLKQGNNKRSAEDDKTDVKKVKQWPQFVFTTVQ